MSDERRYCIGCAHWSFIKGEEAERGYSTWTGGSNGTPAHMSCAKGLWKDLDLDEVWQSDIEWAMEKAQDCIEYSERAEE